MSAVYSQVIVRCECYGFCNNENMFISVADNAGFSSVYFKQHCLDNDSVFIKLGTFSDEDLRGLHMLITGIATDAVESDIEEIKQLSL